MKVTNLYVAYIRVSTKQQEDSGLGLESQQQIIRKEIGREPDKTFIEVESGRKDDRRILRECMAYCRATGATLIVAKLDRLARRLRFACELLESGVQIRVCGMTSMTTLTFHILCAVAEEEARLISERTKAGLAVAKSRGVKLGSARPGHWDGREHLRGCPRGSKVAPVNQTLVTQCKQLRISGRNYQEIADLINAQGHRAPRGGKWTKSQVHRMTA